MRLLSFTFLCLLGATHGFQIAPNRLGQIRGSNNASPVVARRPPLFSSDSSTQSTKDDTKLEVPTLSKWDPVNWTPKRFHNSPLFRSAAILGALALAGYSSKSPLTKLSTKAAATVNILSFGTWFGTVVYTTFVAGITMYKNLPRQTFGKLQSKLFPKYFSLCSFAILLQMLTLQSLPSLANVTGTTRALVAALVMTLLNQFWLEPKSSSTMFRRYELEDDGNKESDEYKKLAASFGKYHGISSLTNLIALCAAIAQGTYLASALIV